MFPALATFTVVAPILLITGIVILSIGVLYRIREQILVSVGFLLLGLAFVSAIAALNSTDENLIITYNWKYSIVKQLEIAFLNPFRGPATPGIVQINAWLGAKQYMVLAATLLILGVTVLSYVGTLMMGVSTKIASALAVIVAILGFAGIGLMGKAVNALVYQAPITEFIKYFNQSAGLRAASILLAFIILVAGAGSIYYETKTRAYLLYSVSFLLSAVGWALLMSTAFYRYQILVTHELIMKNNIATSNAIFLSAAGFIVVGAVGLLIASIIEVISSAAAGLEEVEGLEEIGEEIEEVEGEVEEEAETGAETEEEESGEEEGS